MKACLFAVALPLGLSLANATQIHLGTKPPLRIAIIGAGAGGSSAGMTTNKMGIGVLLTLDAPSVLDPQGSRKARVRRTD